MRPLRDFQKRALEALRDPAHVLCVAPTGSGKSRVFLEWLVKHPRARALILSPLIALGRQHSSLLEKNGVPAFCSMGSAQGRGSAPIPPLPETGAWVLSPESLFSKRTRALSSRVKEWRPDFLVVDECHCVYEWGERFRPEFARVPSLLSELGLKRSLWLTATFPHGFRTRLERDSGRSFVSLGGFGWSSFLARSVVRVPFALRIPALINRVQASREAGLVFCLTRAVAEKIGKELGRFGKRVRVYHAGLEKEARRRIEIEVAQGLVDCVVSTSAFGMGMDFPAFRWVVVWQVPYTLLTLVQMMGRVGRVHGRTDHALVFWDDSDWGWIPEGHEKRRLKAFCMSTDQGNSVLKEYFDGEARKHYVRA